MRSGKFRVQRDAVVAISLSMALFIKLLVKTCEVVHASSSSSSRGKRSANSLEIECLARAVKRYDVLGFMQDLIAEMATNSREDISIGSVEKVLEDTDKMISKRKNHIASDEGAAKKIKGPSQSSITAFFKGGKEV